MTLNAEDADADSAPMEYYMKNITFTRLGRRDPRIMDMTLDERVFHVDARSGEVKTVGSIQNLGDGYFDLVISANNTPDSTKTANTTLRVSKILIPELVRRKTRLRYFIYEPDQVAF